MLIEALLGACFSNVVRELSDDAGWFEMKNPARPAKAARLGRIGRNRYAHPGRLGVILGESGGYADCPFHMQR